MGVWSLSCTLAFGEPRAVPTADPLQRQHVGPNQGGGMIVPTGQLIRPAGQTFAFGGRPVDLAIPPDQPFCSSRIPTA